MNILDKIVEQKKREVAQLPERVLASGDLHDALLERGERRDFLLLNNFVEDVHWEMTND